MKIAVFGSNGFIGSHLVPFLEKEGFTVFPFSRRKGAKYYWDPEKKNIDMALLEGVDVVINLSGENIFGRWTEKKKRELWDSRVNTTQFLVDTIQKLKSPPKLYMGASAVGFYGDRGQEILTEESGKGRGFLSDLCQEIEKRVEVLNIRKAMLRFGVVLGKDGGALAKMVPLFKLGLGAVLGNGKQIMSWIDLEDLLRAILFIIYKEPLAGPINLVSPNPVSNKEFTKILSQVLHRPAIFFVPKIMLKLLLNEGADPFFMSTHVRCKKLLSQGFIFKHPCLHPCLEGALQNNL